MSHTRVALFFNGTWSSSKIAPLIGGGLAGFFHRNVYYNPGNSLVEMHENCEEPNKMIFDGPGTDLLEEKKRTLFSYVKSFAGGMSGNIGQNSVPANLEKAKNYLLKIYKENGKKPLEIDLFGWSRGAFTVDLLKHAIIDLVEEQDEEKKIHAAKIHIHNIDPVPGGLDDRARLAVSPRTTSENVTVTSTTYYSNTGNVNLWDGTGAKYIGNTPAFTALDDATPNAKKYLLNGNHEDLAGQARKGSTNLHKQAVGNLVLSHIVSEASTQGVKFKTGWKKQIYAEATQSQQHYKKSFETLNLIKRCYRRFFKLSTSTGLLGKIGSALSGDHIDKIDSIITPGRLVFKTSMELDEIRDDLLTIFARDVKSPNATKHLLAGVEVTCLPKRKSLITAFNEAFDNIKKNHAEEPYSSNQIYVLRKKIFDTIQESSNQKMKDLFEFISYQNKHDETKTNTQEFSNKHREIQELCVDRDREAVQKFKELEDSLQSLVPIELMQLDEIRDDLLTLFAKDEKNPNATKQLLAGIEVTWLPEREPYIKAFNNAFNNIKEYHHQEPYSYNQIYGLKNKIMNDIKESSKQKMEDLFKLLSYENNQGKTKSDIHSIQMNLPMPTMSSDEPKWFLLEFKPLIIEIHNKYKEIKKLGDEKKWEILQKYKEFEDKLESLGSIKLLRALSQYILQREEKKDQSSLYSFFHKSGDKANKISAVKSLIRTILSPPGNGTLSETVLDSLTQGDLWKEVIKKNLHVLPENVRNIINEHLQQKIEVPNIILGIRR